ncbi:MAG: response regulator [Bacteroidales bacterium]|nr:response regulator [Bacteroidales bacterium]
MNHLRTILLVEDNRNDVELTLNALAANNLANQVVVVRDGIEALEYLRCEGKFKMNSPLLPAVILLDIKMPRLDGIGVLEVIRKDANLKMVPVVMLTSSREEPDLKKCYELGVNAYVVKPVGFNDFFEAVKQLGVFWGIINELPLSGGSTDE